MVGSYVAEFYRKVYWTEDTLYVEKLTSFEDTFVVYYFYR